MSSHRSAALTVPPWISFGGAQTASEESLRATPRTALVSLGVRRLARAILCSAWADLHDRPSASMRPSAWRWRSSGDRPDPETARAWFLALHDRPPSLVWVCTVLRLDPDAVRTRCLAHPPPRDRRRSRA